MRKIIMYMQISLDGVISDLDQWMTLSDEIVEDALEAYDNLDTIVLGSHTYPSMAEFWQAAEKSSESPLERSVAQKINKIKKMVLSRSEMNELAWNNSHPLLMEDSETFVREINKLKQGEGKNISVESGVKTWRLFLEHLLFDELWLYVHPVIAIRGEKLFDDASIPIPLRLIHSKTYKNGVVSLHYQKA